MSDHGPGFKSRRLREYFQASEGRLRHHRIRREHNHERPHMALE